MGKYVAQKLHSNAEYYKYRVLVSIVIMYVTIVFPIALNDEFGFPIVRFSVFGKRKKTLRTERNCPDDVDAAFKHAYRHARNKHYKPNTASIIYHRHLQKWLMHKKELFLSNNVDNSPFKVTKLLILFVKM